MYYVIQIFCSFWLLCLVPQLVINIFRCAIHDHNYVISLVDAMTATSVIALYMLGLPKF